MITKVQCEELPTPPLSYPLELAHSILWASFHELQVLSEAVCGHIFTEHQSDLYDACNAILESQCQALDVIHAVLWATVKELKVLSSATACGVTTHQSNIYEAFDVLLGKNYQPSDHMLSILRMIAPQSVTVA